MINLENCFTVNETTDLCPTGLCLVKGTSNKDESLVVESECPTLNAAQYLGRLIITRWIYFDHYAFGSLFYLYCQSDDCNSKNNAEKVLQLIVDYQPIDDFLFINTITDKSTTTQSSAQQWHPMLTLMFSSSFFFTYFCTEL